MPERYFKGRPEQQSLLAEQERYIVGTLSQQEAADYLGICYQVVRYLTRDLGILPAEWVSFPSVKGRRWWRSDLDAWLDLPNREWLTIPEACRLFGVSKGRFRYQVKTGQLTGIKGAGYGMVYYLRADLEVAALPAAKRNERRRQLAEA